MIGFILFTGTDTGTDEQGQVKFLLMTCGDGGGEAFQNIFFNVFSCPEYGVDLSQNVITLPLARPLPPPKNSLRSAHF